MTTQRVEIRLHDHSLVQVSKTDAGTIYLETYRPGFTKDGHGYLLRGSVILSDEHVRGLLALLSNGQREAA